MKRGVLTLSHTEVIEITNRLPMEAYIGKPLSNKLVAAAAQGDEPERQIEISEEEIEIIMDELAIPSPADKSEITSARKKMQELLMEFRKDIY